MQMTTYTDRFMMNLFISGLAACWIMVGVISAEPLIPGLHIVSRWQLVGASAGLSAIAVLVVPVCWRSIRRRVRWIFGDPSDRAAWEGRIAGLVLGVIFGLVLVTL
ncbi:hypothetical protein [Burkholderia ubonensis]|uniref:hypothetical protein n=1 Tax=Burkholderia ubonensis TaxID=101571 RepID=UPI000ABC133F|nr:hypothetical protein [Burkholderia ubonensis]